VWQVAQITANAEEAARQLEVPEGFSLGVGRDEMKQQ